MSGSLAAAAAAAADAGDADDDGGAVVQQEDGGFWRDEFLAQQLAACYQEAAFAYPSDRDRDGNSNNNNNFRTVTATATTAAAAAAAAFSSSSSGGARSAGTATPDSRKQRSRWNGSCCNNNRLQWTAGAVLAVGVLVYLLVLWNNGDPTAGNSNSNNNVVPLDNYTTIVVEHDGTLVTLERSRRRQSGALYTLVRASGAGGVVPVARTYDGHEWERATTSAAGAARTTTTSTTTTEWDCTERSCRHRLPAGTYFLQKRWHVPTLSGAARFLEQATFGVTRQLLRELEQQLKQQQPQPPNTTTTNGSVYYAPWLQRQIMSTPPTLLRPYFRRRANAEWRHHQPEFAAAQKGDDPCRVPHGPSSSWRRALFSVRDRDAAVSFRRRQRRQSNSTTTDIDDDSSTRLYWEIAVNHQVRAVVERVAWAEDEHEHDSNNGDAAFFAEGDDYQYCSTNDQTRRGEFRVRGPGQQGCRRLEERLMVVDFVSSSSSTTTTATAAAAASDYGIVLLNETLPALSDASFWHRHLPFDNNNLLVAEYIAQQPIASTVCASLPDASLPLDDDDEEDYATPPPPVLARTVAGEWLVWTPRVDMRTNTVEEPLPDGGAAALAAGRTQACANAPRTLFNEEHCVLSSAEPACRAGSHSSSSSSRGNNWTETNTTAGVVLCGSPGEVANNVSLGDHWLEVASLTPQRAEQLGRPADTATADPNGLARQREFVWADVVLGAPDQLRHRVAWVLFQIFAMAKNSIRDESVQTESFLNYYDIFVRNAFGNYLDVLREVSYNPLMAENLSYLNSQSLTHVYGSTGQLIYPDENFARELMQLHTIGLVRLNLDGTADVRAETTSQTTTHTYDNEDILSMARAWTGFVAQPPRANIEAPAGINAIDPLRIDPLRRDHFPKTDLDGGFLGDGYPLCEDLPPRPFLRVGAKYRLLGASPLPDFFWSRSDFTSDAVEDNAKKRLRLQPGMGLYEQLCASDVDGACTHPSVVTLDRNLSYCDEKEGGFDECTVETVRVVQVDNLFYEYIQSPCVQLAFYNDGKKAVQGDISRVGVCANPRLPVASEVCCGTTEADQVDPSCVFSGERMTLDGARARCSLLGANLCGDIRLFAPTEECADQSFHWTTEDCSVRVKVRSDGYVAIVHHLADGDVLENLQSDWPGYFRVYWNDGVYPSVSENNCGDSWCDQYEDTCICIVSVTQLPVFSSPPGGAKDILSNLRVGHAGPEVFDDGAYIMHTEGDYQFSSLDGSCCDADTVFEVTNQIGKTQFFLNVESKVSIGSSFSFRNPPHFNSFLPTEHTGSEAQYETEALLQHLFGHPNTAPFVATRFIQRFGISNPGPRYVRVAAVAFREGIYTADDGTKFGTGTYGDLQALVAAVLLDREARSLALAGDPSHGALKEPLLKVLGFLRAMEFKVATPLLELDKMDTKIGQMVFEQNSVFSFFSPDYVPPGPIASSMLASPESQVMSTTRVIGLLNGLLGLVQYGLVECRDGFGAFGPCKSPLPARQSSGRLMYEPIGYASATVVKDLSVLLTSGRLNRERVVAIQRSYEDERFDPVVGLLLAMQLIITSPEFHSTSFTETENDPVVPPTNSDSSTNRPNYKAVIHLALSGGCDSFNVLVPSSLCGRLYQEYIDVRETVALRPDQVLPIGGNLTGQPCAQFGLHHKLPFLKSLFDVGDLLFLANTGILTEPVDRSNYTDLTLARLFAHDAMQEEVNTLDPRKDAIGTGVLGRLADILQRNGFRTDRIVVEGLPTHLAGRSSSPIVTLDRQGVSSLNLESPDRPLLEEFIESVGTGADESGTLGSLWSSILGGSLGQNRDLVDLLGPTSKSDDFRRDTRLGRKFQLIGKLITSHEDRGVDRDVFFVSMPGFDSHADVSETLEERFEELNAALQDFASKLQAQGFWNSVAIVQTSEFARTLSPNSGEGTDHAWGGNYWIAGGAVSGGRILGKYPSTFAEGNPLAAGWRGRLIPTTPWDAVFNGLMAWMAGNSTSADQLDYVLPNRLQFPNLFSSRNLFTTTPS